MTQRAVPIYGLYGQTDNWLTPEPLHCETISKRGTLHNWEIKPHRHIGLIQVLFLASGSCTVTLDDIETQAEAPMLAYVAPLTIHGFDFAPGSDGHVVTLTAAALDEHLAELVGLKSGDNASMVLGGEALGAALRELELVFPRLLEEFTHSHKGRLAAMKSYLSLIMIHIDRARNVHATNHPHFRSLDEGRAIAFRQLIDETYLQHQPVSFYASRLAVSQTKLVSLTRTVFRCSPQTLIHARLMLEARRNIIYTNMSIAEAAYVLGFKDPAYFSRFFKKYEGETPGAYRRKNLLSDTKPLR